MDYRSIGGVSNGHQVDNEPCCSKSLDAKRLIGNSNKNTDATIIIDGEDSNDSAYETGSAFSRSSSLSSPIPDLQESKDAPIDLTKKRSKIAFYANYENGVQTVSPWRMCFYIKESRFNTKVQTKDETIVLSDSDDDADKDSSSSSQDNNDIISIKSDSDDDDMKQHLVEFEDGTIKLVPDYCIAYGAAPENFIKLKSQTRIIARRKSKFLPVVTVPHLSTDEKDSEKAKFIGKHIYDNDDTAFYPGITGCNTHTCRKNGRWYNLVFFDDGHVQYVKNADIRIVFGTYGTKYVHPNAKQFFDYYFIGLRNTNQVEMDCAVGKNYLVSWDSAFEIAEVIQYDRERPALALLFFSQRKILEWLYVGSPRFQKVWTEILKDKKYQDANATMIEVSSDSEEENDDYVSPVKRPLSSTAKNLIQKEVCLFPRTLIDNYKEPRDLGARHTCSNNCVRQYEENEKIFDFDPLKRPLLAGWKRKMADRIYIYDAPCGRTCYTIENIHRYLVATDSKLSIDCFCLSANIECMIEKRSQNGSGKTYYLNDLIKGGQNEKQRIPVVPIDDNMPHFKEYVTQYHRNPRSKKVPAILNDKSNPFRSCCDCTDDCSNKSKCSCWRLTTKDDPKSKYGYKYKRLLDKVFTGIYECNPGCKCSKNCLNRVVSAQVEQKLELYETKDRGYGIRCQIDLPKGTFVSCYFGDLLHGKTADERAMKKVGSIHGDEYFMQLDYIEVAERHKDGYESDFSSDEDKDEDDDDEFRSVPSKRFKPDTTTGVQHFNTNNIHSYYPKIKKKRVKIDVNPRTALFGANAVEFVVDGRYRGNISRFYNHSCQPNIFSQTVFVDTHDLRFPWLAFFTSEDIKAGTELTWDYSYVVGGVEGREILCKCGAKNCRKRLL